MAEFANLQDIISQNVERIRSVVQDCSTQSVVGYSMVKSLRGFPQPDLSSPAKQLRFLLGVMLQTREPDDPSEFSDQEWERIVEPIQKLSDAYMTLYLPNSETIPRRSPERDRIEQVAMTAFLDYHQKGLLASAEQIEDRIRSYLAPFDELLSSTIGFSASDALDIALGIGDTLQDQMDRVSQYASGSSDSADLSFESATAIDRLGKTRRDDLIQRWGSTGERFWDFFTVRRGEGPIVNYPTESSIVEKRPLVCLSDDEAMLFDFNILLSAILSTVEEILANGPAREQYFRKRDKTLEDHSSAVLRRILGREAREYRNVFETPGSQYEHDLVILTRDICLFVEAKASPMDEPFRDPEKAFVRIQRSFRSESGIQRAYDQTLRLYRKLQNEELVLFDEKGAEALRLPSSVADNAFCVCVTRDSFGPIATFLSPLLSKGMDDPYPWVVNIFDLEQIAEAWEYFGWDGRQLKSLLSQRIRLHENVVSDDELDYVGAYIRHCGLQHFARNDYDLMQLNPTYALVFDDIYFHVRHGQARVVINPSYPFTADLQESMRVGNPVPAEGSRQGPIQVGRNEPCPCGSTVKFKRCHGQ